jgi:hypothetical protein
VDEDGGGHPAILPTVTADDVARIATGYRAFADVEAQSVSPPYARLARAVADDAAVLGFLADLPPGKRQPNLLFAALQFLHGEPADATVLREWVLDDADRVRTTVLTRATQTNEPARCGALLPALAQLDGPLALIEVGASAGLCLYPDRYSYDYDGRPVGARSTVHVSVATSGPIPVPDRLPGVAARIGVDLHPLDPSDPDVRAWLRALVWPGPLAAERLARLDAAAQIAAAEPATMLTGDLLDRLPDALALVPDGATPVVFHTAVLVYLPRERRRRFVELVRSLPVSWIAQEGPDVLPEQTAALPEGHRGGGGLVLALDGRPVARTAPHGGRIDWTGPTTPG